MAVKLVLRDWIFWLIAALCAVSIGAAWFAKPTGPGTEGTAPLAGQSGQERHASVAVPSDDPVLLAVMNGTFPKVDSQLTLSEAFARYRWFSGPAKWLGKGPAASRTALMLSNSAYISPSLRRFQTSPSQCPSLEIDCHMAA